MATDVRVTAEMLRKTRACEGGLAKAVAAFPGLEKRGVKPTLANIKRAYKVLRDDVFWLDDLLKTESYRTYRDARREAWDVYEATKGKAWRVYNEACLAALAKAFEGLSNDDLRGA